jgi:hypothetical protein
MEDVPIALALLRNLPHENPREQSRKSCETISWADFTSNFLKGCNGLISTPTSPRTGLGVKSRHSIRRLWALNAFVSVLGWSVIYVTP